MATAFTRAERESIDRSLVESALRLAARIGMRHTTVDELAHEAGISKGAFYSFYESKEHLFLRAVEALHGEMYGGAERVFAERGDLPLRERTILAVREVWAVADKYNAAAFIREDVPYLLRRLPRELIDEHYRSDEEHIRAFISGAGVRLNTGIDTACAVIRLLLMTLLMRGEVGENFEEAVRLMIEGACAALVG